MSRRRINVRAPSFTFVSNKTTATFACSLTVTGSADAFAPCTSPKSYTARSNNLWTFQVRATDPGYVADLGCGPGNLTAVLARRWPGAEVVGVDNSAAMITAATESARATTLLPGGVGLPQPTLNGVES